MAKEKKNLMVGPTHTFVCELQRTNSVEACIVFEDRLYRVDKVFHKILEIQYGRHDSSYGTCTVSP